MDTAFGTILAARDWGMDRYSVEMIARGPTLASDGDTATGSVHILDLASPAAARAFALEEPNYQAGVYRDVLLRRWHNRLGRTMWEFTGGREGGDRFLVLGLGAGWAADLALPSDPDEVIAYGPLLADDGITWLGTAALVRASVRDRGPQRIQFEHGGLAAEHEPHAGGLGLGHRELAI